jgi:lipopolysaccharide export system protein LptA
VLIIKNFWVILFMTWLIFCITSATFAAVSHKFFRADKQYYDAETGTYTISGNIVINVGNGTITGDKALVKLSTWNFGAPAVGFCNRKM